MKIKLPLKLDDPIMQTLNVLIADAVDEIQWRQSVFNQRAEEIAKRPPFQFSTISYERTRHTDRDPGENNIRTHQIDEMIQLLNGMKTYIDRSEELTRTKLSLLKDVDFQGGTYWIKQFAKHGVYTPPPPPQSKTTKS